MTYPRCRVKFLRLRGRRVAAGLRFGALVLFACTLTQSRKVLVPPSVRPANHTCVAPPRPAAPAQVTRAYPRVALEQPVAIAASPDHAWWFVAERGGRIIRIAAHDEDTAGELVLDMSSRVDASTAAIGLLAIAIHPRFAQNGQLFVSYTAPGGTLTTSRVARFVSRDGGRSFEYDRELIELDQISDYHVNADLRFGPDGFLYVGFGDGGPQNDPHGHAQDPHALKGKILRLDVDAGERYGIPADNPYAQGGGAPEVWALGLRNPWRFAFDRETGELWAGDVGADHFEEIDRITRGGNYGWPAREGTRCNTRGCKHLSATDPLVALAHPEVSSITFGVAYRGSALSGMRGHLIYADYPSGVIWAIDPGAKVLRPRILANAAHAPVAFAEDAAGEPLMVDHTGSLWRIGPGHGGPADVPALLSETGCFERGGAPSPSLIPYEVNVAFWSDGSAKQRWFAIPDGTKIGITREGHLDLPVGSVVAKEFALEGMRVETRLYVRHADGEWAGYSYRWDDHQSDAHLLPLEAKSTVAPPPRAWYFPHRGECSRCHQEAAGRTIGLELAQLDRKVGGIDQLAALSRLGLFDRPVPAVQPLPTPYGGKTGATVEQRARAWLHENCSYCHRPGGGGQGDLDLRYDTPLARMGVCNVVPRMGSFAVKNALIIAPGEPSRSMLYRRILSKSFVRMPPMGSLTIDPEGAAVIEQWIKALRCP